VICAGDTTQIAATFTGTARNVHWKQANGLALADVQARFEAMARAIEDPARYAVWHVPVVSARKP
jgi:hypothetical protein